MPAPRTGAWKVGLWQLLPSFECLRMLIDVLPRLPATTLTLEKPCRSTSGRNSALNLPSPPGTLWPHTEHGATHAVQDYCDVFPQQSCHPRQPPHPLAEQTEAV